MPNFDFGSVYSTQYKVDIKDTGEFTLKATGEDASGSVYCFYLIAHSYMGSTTFYSWGPISEDTGKLRSLSFFKCNVVTMEYKPVRIHKYISCWLDDREKLITAAAEIDEAEALKSCPNLLDYIGAEAMINSEVE